MKGGSLRRDARLCSQLASFDVFPFPGQERGVALMASESAKPAKARIVPRYPFEARFKIRIERSESTLETEGWARDLSESGLCAFVATPISLGESATLRIPLGKAELVIPSRITRVDGTQYGFQFTALSSEQRDHILGAIAGKKAIPYQAPSA